MDIVIESVDDGGEGYLTTNINGKNIKNDDTLLFFYEVIESLGYPVTFVNTTEMESQY